MVTPARMFHGIAIVWLAVVLQACASAPPDAHLVPDEPGLYAVQSDEPVRIDGDADWEKQTWSWRSSMPEQSQFIVFAPGQNLADQPSKKIFLRQVAWVRSEISPEGQIMPNTGSQWDVPTLDAYLVPVTFSTVAGRADTILVSPQGRLQPGLYELQLRAGDIRESRLGVNWPNVDQNAYAATHCVDLYQATGSGAELQPCDDQQKQLAAVEDLNIQLVNPMEQVIDGVSTLVIQGVITSTSDRSQNLPMLVAELRDATGQVLDAWQFAPPAQEIEPGQSITFETRSPSMPANTDTVHVDFGSVPTG